MKKIDMQTENKIYLTRKFNCSVEDLFDWLIKPEQIAQWFGPKQFTVSSVKTDLQKGGNYSIELKKPDGSSFAITGEYLQINAPENLVFTFRYEGLSPAPPKSEVQILLTSISSTQSSLSLIQKFESTPSNMVKRTKAWENMFAVLGNLA